MKNQFSVGHIVAFKSHPLLYDIRIKGDGKLVPPFMIVKEVYIENKNKKLFDDITGERIAERIKYTCVYFDDNKSEFKEAVLYESQLFDYNKIFIERMKGKGDEIKEKSDYESLIDEANNYSIPKYNYANIVYFKTKKFEIFKKRSSISLTKNLESEKKKDFKKKETVQYVVNYSTPEFILCGIKKEKSEDLFYPDGKIKKKVAEIFYKVKWFNCFQMKFSEIFLPAECFTDVQPFETKIKHN